MRGEARQTGRPIDRARCWTAPPRRRPLSQEGKVRRGEVSIAWMHAGPWHGHGNQPAASSSSQIAAANSQQPTANEPTFTEACEVGSGLAGCSGSMQDARWMQDAKQQADAGPAMGRYCNRRRRWELEWEYWEGGLGAWRSGSLWLWPWIISLSLSVWLWDPSFASG